MAMRSWSDGGSPRKSVDAFWVCSPQPDGVQARLEVPSTFGLQKAEFTVGPQMTTRTKEVALYEGEGETIPEGQPAKVKRFEANYRMSSEWGGALNPFLPKMPSDSRAAGTYKFVTSSVGTCSLDLGEEQEFLPPVKLMTPSTQVVSVGTGFLVLEWEPVEGAVGYAVRATGESMSGDKAFWFAPKAYAKTVAQKGPVAALDAGCLYGPDQTRCVLPAGVFKTAIVSVHAFSSSVSGQGSVPGRAWSESTASFDLK